MTDVNQLITEHLDIWTAATEKKSSAGRGNGGGISQYGVSKLRQLITELAVRGSLVPQIDADGNANQQLIEVAADKRRALKQGQIKGVRGLVEESGRLGFGVPEKWATVRLDSIAWPQAGFAFKSKGFNTMGTGLPLIRIRDVGKEFSGTFFAGDHRTEFVVENGDYLISMDGEFRVCPWTNGPALLNQRVSRLVFFSELVSPKFVSLALQFELSALQGVKAYTTVDHLSTKQIANASLPFPPLAEQHRIVDKVDELMALCDALERQAEDSLKAHQTLVETCLATLTNSQSAEDFTQNWTRTEAHFDTLFTTKESVQALEAAIVELGVTGLLVPQSEADEPATQLLQRVAKDIAAYSKLNKVRPVKPTKISKQESPAERLPAGWVETRLSSLFRVVTDGDHQAPPRASDGVAFLTIGNISSGQLNFEGCRRVPDDYYKGLPVYRTPGLGDILYTVVGATYGRPVLVETEEQFCVQRHIAILRPSVELDVDYLVWMLKSAWVYNQAREGITGSAQPTLALKPLRNFLVLLPPRAQQKRISSKIKQLHQLTARLRESISVSTETQVSLADTLTSNIH